MSYLSSSEELGHSFDGMVFGSVLLLLFFRYSLHRSPTVVLSYLWENIEYFSVLFQTFVNIICHMIRGLKISLCVLFCFGFFLLFLWLSLWSSRTVYHLFTHLFWSVSCSQIHLLKCFLAFQNLHLHSFVQPSLEKKIHFNEHTCLSCFYWLHWLKFFWGGKWPLDGSISLRWVWAAVYFFQIQSSHILKSVHNNP